MTKQIHTLAQQIHERVYADGSSSQPAGGR